ERMPRKRTHSWPGEERMPGRKRPRVRRRGRSRERTSQRAGQVRERVAQPATGERLTWYLGLALMAAFEGIDWPVAVVIAVGHELAGRARDRALREFSRGLEAGA